MYLVYALIKNNLIVYVGKSSTSGIKNRLFYHKSRRNFDSHTVLWSGESEANAFLVESQLISALRPEGNKHCTEKKPVDYSVIPGQKIKVSSNTLRGAVMGYLAEADIPQKDLSAAYGCTPSAMSQFLSGASPFPSQHKIIIAISKLVSSKIRCSRKIVSGNGKTEESFLIEEV